MNNLSSDNQAANDRFGFSQQTVDMAEEFLSSDLTILTKKYGSKIFEKIFVEDENYFSVIDDLKSRQRRIVAVFWPKNQRIDLAPAQRRQIIEIIANLQADNTVPQIDEKLKQINQNLTVPPGLDFTEIHTQASLLSAGFFKLETILLNQFAPEYLPDVLNLYRLDDAKRQVIISQIHQIAEKLAQEIEKLTHNWSAEVSDIAKKEATQFLGQLGRVRLVTQQEQNLGQLADIYMKLEVAAQAAEALKKRGTVPLDQLNDTTMDEIKKVLKPGLQI